MDFNEIYKRVDNICKDKFSSEKGITEYIDLMKSCNNYRCKSSEWTNTYNKLREIRHKRNNIAHENGYTVENTITSEDENWLFEFYDSLLDRTDVLSEYYNRLNSTKKSMKTQPKEIPWENEKSPRKATIGDKLFLLLTVVLIGLIWYFYIF